MLATARRAGSGRGMLLVVAAAVVVLMCKASGVRGEVDGVCAGGVHVSILRPMPGEYVEDDAPVGLLLTRLPVSGRGAAAALTTRLGIAPQHAILLSLPLRAPAHADVRTGCFGVGRTSNSLSRSQMATPSQVRRVGCTCIHGYVRRTT